MQAERDVIEGERRLAEQERLIVQLKREGQNTAKAERNSKNCATLSAVGIKTDNGSSRCCGPDRARANTLQRSYGTALRLINSRNETARQSFFEVWRWPMNALARNGACAFAWRNYLLLHSGVSENDYTRSALYRYVANLCDTGQYDFDLLQIAAVAYLKNLDELHDDRSARLAADDVLAECLESRGARPGIQP